MEYNFSNKAKGIVKTALINDNLNHQDKDLINFYDANPGNNVYPIGQILAILNFVLKNQPEKTLKYSAPEGLSELREQLKRLLKEREGFDFKNDNLLVTSGAKQAIDLIAKTFIDPLDVVICENPTYFGAVNSFKANGARVIPVDIQEDGVDINALEKVAAENSVKIFYTIPNFQNPTGITTSFEKRKAILELACKYNFLILEDDSYGELRFRGKKIPSLKSIDTQGNVVYASSFSPVLAPGLRIGHICLPCGIANHVNSLKQSADGGTNTVSQMIVYEFLRNYNYTRYIDNLRKTYYKKMNLTLSLIKKMLSKAVEVIQPDGGFFLWCTLNNIKDVQAFCDAALSEQGVLIAPPTEFYIGAPKASSFRINYTAPKEIQIEKGIRRLGHLIEKYDNVEGLGIEFNYT